METKKGTLENARIFVKQGNFYIAGEEMKKVGECRYTMSKRRVHHLRLGQTSLEVYRKRCRCYR